MAGGAMAFAACSLGLDATKIGADAAGDGLVPPTDAPIVPDGSNPVQCTGDGDCVSANKCLAGTCDQARHVCSYAVCPTGAACKAATCFAQTKTCSVATSYGFHAGTFHVSAGGIGCGGAARCFAAVYPFAFIGTTNGVVARSVADPTDGASETIPVGGLPFFPAFIVSNGTRVYFVGSVGGNGPEYKLPIASLDVPADPTVTAITATTVFDTVPVSSLSAVWPDTKGGVYLVNGDGGKSFPVAHVTAPLQDLQALQFFPLAGIPANHGPIKASGDRIATFYSFGNYQTAFSLEQNAATGSAQNGGSQETTAAMGTVAGAFYFAQSSTGGLAWATTSVDPGDASPPQGLATRVGWLLGDQTKTTFDSDKHVDIEAYPPNTGAGGDQAGPIAWLDADRLLVLSAPASNLAQTSVQIATRNPSPAVVANRKFVLPYHPSELGATASSGFGYVLTPDQVLGANVHVFATGCDN